MDELVKRYNKRVKFGLKSKNTGKIISKFRLSNTAKFMKSKYERLYLEELEVVKL